MGTPISVRAEAKIVARHSFIYGVTGALTNLVSFILLPLYTTYLSPRDYGIKELVAISTEVVGTLLATAISSAVNRFYFEQSDESGRNQVVSTALISIGVLMLVVLSLLSFAAHWIAEIILDSGSLGYLFVISFASLWFQTMFGLGTNYLRANEKSILFGAISLTRLVIAVSLNIFFIVYMKLGVTGIFLSTLITSSLACVAVNVPIIYRIGMRFSLEVLKDMVKFGIPLVPAQLSSMLAHISDRYFLKAYCSVAETGIYSLGYRFGTLTGNFVATPFNMIWEPRRLALYKKEGAEPVFGRIFTYFIGLMVFVGLGVAILSKEVIMIMAQKEYWQSYTIVPVIVLANIVFSMHYHFNLGIIISKKTKYLAYINVSNGILVLTLNYWLTRKYGMHGAAVATLFAFTYKTALTYYFGRKDFRVMFEFRRIATLLCLSAAIYSVTLLLGDFSMVASILAKCALLFSFPLLLYAAGFFLPEEMSYVKSRLSAIVASGKALV